VKLRFCFGVAVMGIVLIAILSACSQTTSKKQNKIVWYKDISLIGSQSSPRASDLNKDGTLDIVIGAGKNEFQESDMGIIAFDGRSGELLWKVTAADQVYGSATF